MVLQKILEKVFITNKFTRWETSRSLKIDEFEIPYNKNIGKSFSKYELLFLDQAYSSSDPSQILILQFPILRVPCLPHHPCRILTTQLHKYWIYHTICKSKPIKLNIKLYTDHNSWWVKHAPYQSCLSKLGNTVNNKIVGAPSFSQPFLHTQSPWNLH